MKVTITRAKMLATLKKSQAAALKAQQAEIAKAQKEHDKNVADAIVEATKILANLKSKGFSDGLRAVCAFDPNDVRCDRRYGYYDRHALGERIKIGETIYDQAIAFVDACEDKQFVLDVERDKTGLSQVFFAALKR